MVGLAQQSPPVHYTTKEGLPSNVVYQSLEDNDGFLWLATDQGLARFDGRNFQVFAKAEGVPDIEVIQLAKEKNGRLWIRCYNNRVAFFDPVHGRFIDVTAFTGLLGIRKITDMRAVEDGGIQFNTELCSYLFSDLLAAGVAPLKTPDSTFLIRRTRNGSLLCYSRYGPAGRDSFIHILHVTQGKVSDDRSTGIKGRGKEIDVNHGRLFVFERQSENYDRILPGEKDLVVQHLQLLNPYYVHHFTEAHLTVFERLKDPVTAKDIMRADVYSREDQQFLFHLDEHTILFHVLQDHAGQLWLSTLEDGLLQFKPQVPVRSLLGPPYDEVIFYGISGDGHGRIFAGNEKGEVLTLQQQGVSVHKVASDKATEWQRLVLQCGKNVYAFSDGGIFVNYTHEIRGPSGGHIEAKVALFMYDSLLITGATGLYKINIRDERVEALSTGPRLFTALVRQDHDHFYAGTTLGLMRYDLAGNRLEDLSQRHPLLSERIMGMTMTADGLLWIATATNGLLVLQNEKVIDHILEADGLASNNLSTITHGEPGETWIGTAAGISHLHYRLSGGRLDYRLQNISSIDGLRSNRINQLYYEDKQVYAATEKGISLIPDSIPVTSIPLKLTRVQVNQKDTLLSMNYHLAPNQKNITLQFTGVQLGGYFHHVDYSLDQGQQWTSLAGSVLRQEFEHGEHIVWARAVDVNKNISSSILKVHIDIATPFWKTWWFWILVMVLIQAMLAYVFFRRQKQKEEERRKQELAKAHLASLEQQAFTSLMNPHFMFNALNSIQHYINHQDRQNANRYLSDFASLIRKNFEAAQQAFIPLEQEMENISLYLRLETMRFNDKFTFQLNYAPDFDPDDWMMPTMILQPLVENAILHGMMPSQIPGRLLIRLSVQNDDLLLEVTDNGIGIENSRALKHGSKHRSRGMELIHKRLHALSFFCHREIELLYSVPYEDRLNPGSRVSLCIPSSLYQSWKKAQQEYDQKPAKS